MDGYAVRSDDAAPGRRLRVIGTASAGGRFAGTVGAGEAVRIYTGAPVPDGADYIVIQEDVDRRDEDDRVVTVREARDRDPYIRPAGGDFLPGARVAAPRRLGVADITLLAAMGAGRLTVARRPAVALIPTGDELVPSRRRGRPRPDLRLEQLRPEGDGRGGRRRGPAPPHRPGHARAPRRRPRPRHHRRGRRPRRHPRRRLGRRPRPRPRHRRRPRPRPRVPPHRHAPRQAPPRRTPRRRSR